MNLNILNDEELKEHLNSVLSGMLPHEFYEPARFSTLLDGVFKLITLDEMRMEYFVMFSILNQISEAISSSKDIKMEITRDIFETLVSGNIDDFILDYRSGIKEYLQSNLLNSEMKDELVRENARQELYARSMELYDSCISKKVTSEQALVFVEALKISFGKNASELAVNTQREILLYGKTIGKTHYSGVKGWIAYVEETLAEMRLRLASDDSTAIHMKDAKSTNKLNEQVKNMFTPIASYGWEPLDSVTRIMRHSFVTIAGQENIGKTGTMIHLCMRIVLDYKIDPESGKEVATSLNNKRIAIMCGENVQGLVKSQILIAYIHRTRKKFVKLSQLADRDSCSEEMRRIINLAEMEIEQSANFVYISKLWYKGLYFQYKKYYDEYNFDVMFVDHTMALAGPGNIAEKAAMFAEATRDFKKDYPVTIIALSHLSHMAKEALAKNKEIGAGPAKGGDAVGTESDFLYVLTQTTAQKKAGLINVYIHKLRHAPKTTDNFNLNTKLDVFLFEYDRRFQTNAALDKLNSEQKLMEVAAALASEDVDDDEYVSFGDLSDDDDEDEDEDDDDE